MAISLSGMTEFNTTARNKILNVHIDIDAGLVPIKIPLVTSGSNLGLNLLGKSVKIIVDGEYFGTVAQMTAFVLEFRTWADISHVLGGSVERKTFVGPFHTWYVKPMTFNYDYNFGVVGKVSYQMTMFRSADPDA